MSSDLRRFLSHDWQDSAAVSRRAEKIRQAPSASEDLFNNGDDL